MMGNIGIYAGTFDPIHKGHIEFALSAIEKANLDRVILLPERCPRRKLNVTPFADRIEMLKLAAQISPKLEVVALKQDQFTVTKTLPELQRRFGHKIVLLVGSDEAKHLERWPDLKVLIAQVDLCVGLRAGDSRVAIEALLTAQGWRFICIAAGATGHIASRSIRLQGQRGFIDPHVQSYITANKLYPLAFPTN
ncbi:MAG TPA: nicotinate-nicotinamide nucleotide adenylyltransferase [Candidatus Saccharimonadales bacterium]|nr:nicotinate-nicotinamide nucleotide adenylyltransferase [Candidatus Saccharimonadales bacterium]